MDAYPDLRAENVTQTGYFGLTGIDPALVMESLTGLTGSDYYRTQGTNDPAIQAGLAKCYENKLACVIGTPNVDTVQDDLPGYPVPNLDGVIQTPQSDMTVTGGDDPTILVTDLVLGTSVRFVEDHAYGIVGYEVDANGTIVVSLRNPWGSNPSVQNATVLQDNVTEKLSLDALWSFAVGVYLIST